MSGDLLASRSINVSERGLPNVWRVGKVSFTGQPGTVRYP